MHPPGNRPSSKWNAAVDSPGGGYFRYRPMATAYFTNPKAKDRLAQLWSDLRAEAVPFYPIAPQKKAVHATLHLGQDERIRRNWKADLSTLFESLLEPEMEKPPIPFAAEASSKGDALSELSIEAAHDAALALSSPFHWEPKPAWIKLPGRSTPALLNPADPRLFV